MPQFTDSLFTFFLAGCVLIAGCDSEANRSSSLPANADLDDVRAVAIADIHQTLDQLETDGLYGVARLTYGDTVIIHQALGFRDREARAPMEVTTGFDIGSITKVMTAATVLKLEEQGQLWLSDPISRFFPDAPYPLREATVAQLIEHRAGLPEYLGDDYERVTKEQALDRLFEVDLQFEPGSDEAYSNAGYTLLAAIVEEVSGQPFEQTLREAVLLPATPRIGYRLAEWESGDLAVGYVQNQNQGTPLDKPWLDDGPSWTLRGNGGLLATTEDVAHWFDAMFEGQILDPDALNKFKALFTASGPYGIRVGEAGGDDATGFNAQHEAWPEVGITWTFITSRASYPAEENWPDVQDSITRLLEVASRTSP
ncbi:serine hydrolase domain-containing protein [Vacuolonema iberomarrocanum]|uniref:serine hydrolase domain-containing protein n=1 Tax=Vacuolonema iberomarrocanum TaxID=3454632 RepID=UPI0019F4B0A9|nr:beta-lactamase family protein [filamentous cyanobacterium LEGE 07170]